MNAQPTTRRAIIAGLAAAPIAAVPAVARLVAADDPVFPALALLKRAKNCSAAVVDKFNLAEHAYLEARPERLYVALAAQQFYTLENFDEATCDGSFAGESAVKAAREELSRIVAADAEARKKTGFDQAEAAWNEAVDAEDDAARAVIDAEPAAPAGAIPLLRFLADDLSSHSGDEAEVSAALRRSVAVLAREARA